MKDNDLLEWAKSQDTARLIESTMEELDYAGMSDSELNIFLGNDVETVVDN